MKGRSARLFGDKGILTPYCYLLPYGLFFAVFFAYPLLNGFYVSLTEYILGRTSAKFIGFGNYSSVIQDPEFLHSLKNTFLFVLESTPPLVVVPLVLALAINTNVWGTTWFRMAFVCPMAISVSVITLLWKWILAPNWGLLNYYLEQFGLKPQAWLVRPGWSLFAVVIATVWWTIGYNTLMFLAGLQDIPDHLSEAAQIDGASSWQIFLNVILPCLRPILLLVTVLQIIASFKIFGQVNMMTQGGPGTSSKVVVQYIYETGFRFYNMGKASAAAWVLFVVILVFSLLQLKFMSGNEVEY